MNEGGVTMFRRNLIPVWLGILVLSGMFLMGQVGWYEPPPPEEVTVSILAQVDPRYPNEFDGLVAGDPVPDAEVQITKHGEVVASGFTNSEGEVAFELLEGETYGVGVVADTSASECWWREGSAFYLTGPSDVTLDVWTDGPDCVGPPVEISFLVRLDPQFPDDDFGLMPGDPVPYAEVEITNRTSGELVASGTTDENGEIVLEVPGISDNYVYGRTDPNGGSCFLLGGEVFVVVTEPLGVILDLWLACA
jgi:hypothetical protein